MNSGVVCAVVVAVASGSACGIVVRHDRADRDTIELGAQYPATVSVGGGSGTLIAPDWVLTAGHVAAGFMLAREPWVEIDGERFEVDRAFAYGVDRSDAAGGLIEVDGERHDIGLIRLAQPAEGSPTMRVYRGDDERGKQVVLVGLGDHGHGDTGPVGHDGQRRAATNTIDGAAGGWIRLDFDEPPDGTEIEGISAGGDSGGPVILDLDGRAFVVGVSSHAEDSGRSGPATYGVRDWSARVSHYTDWIDTTMAHADGGKDGTRRRGQARRGRSKVSGSRHPGALVVGTGIRCREPRAITCQSDAIGRSGGA